MVLSKEDVAYGFEGQVLLAKLWYEGARADAGDGVRLLHCLAKLEGLLVSQFVDSLQHVGQLVHVSSGIGAAALRIDGRDHRVEGETPKAGVVDGETPLPTRSLLLE